MPHAFPRTIPLSYRFQIREHTRVPFEDGERDLYGAVVWDADDPKRKLQERSYVALAKTDELAESLGRPVSLGIVSADDPSGPFQGEYFARPAAEPRLQLVPAPDLGTVFRTDGRRGGQE